MAGMKHILYLFIIISVVFLYSGCKMPSPDDGYSQASLNNAQLNVSVDPPGDPAPPVNGGYMLANSLQIESLDGGFDNESLMDSAAVSNFGPEDTDTSNSDEKTHINPEPNTILMFMISLLGIFGFGVVGTRKRKWVIHSND